MVAWSKTIMVSAAVIAASLSSGEAATAESKRRLGVSSFISGLVAPFTGGIDNLKESAVEGIKDLGVDFLSWYFGDTDLVIDPNDPRFDDTIFTTDNYYGEQLDFLLAGLKSDNGQAMQDWYLQGTGASEIRSGLVRNGPGPNTKMFLSYNGVKAALEEYGDRIEADTLERKNELGIQILNGNLWPETPGGVKTIGLGQTKENHAFVRPLLAKALDKGTGSSCDGSTCWNDAWLTSKAKAFFNGKTEFHTSDIKWFTTQILHKLHLNMDLNEADARRFADYMSKMIILIPLSDSMLNDSILESVLSIKDTKDKKAGYLTACKNAIYQKYASEDFVKNNDVEKIELLASVYLDSLQFAGGLSVPTVLSYMLALTQMSDSNKHASLKGQRLSLNNFEWIMWETLRKYAPVAGVPSWIPSNGNDWQHVIPNVAAALTDADVFENPMQFKNRGIAKYHQTMMKNGDVPNAGIGWAGPAIHKNSNGEFDTAAPHSHNCPAQDLSFRLMKAFVKEFVNAGPWSAVDADDISVTAYSASGFKLLKTGMSYNTSYSYKPSCKEGYSWVSTRWKWWGQRSWTCKVL